MKENTEQITSKQERGQRQQQQQQVTFEIIDSIKLKWNRCCFGYISAGVSVCDVISRDVGDFLRFFVVVSFFLYYYKIFLCDVDNFLSLLLSKMKGISLEKSLGVN